MRLRLRGDLVAGAFLALVLLLLGGQSGDSAAQAAQADGDPVNGMQVYSEKCASCHQAGGVGVVGAFPPLAANPNAADAAYVEEVIEDGLAGQIEVLGESFDATMPAVTGLSDGDLADLVSYVVSIADVEAVAEPAGEPDGEVAEAEPGNIDEGHDLFVGSTRLSEGAAACASCHTAGEVGNLGGYSLGPSLDNTFENLGGEAGLAAWLANPASETMAPIFEDHPMTEAEIADVVAFLGDAPSQDKPSDSLDWLLVAGIVGALILIGGMAVFWRGMRQTYAQRLRSMR